MNVAELSLALDLDEPQVRAFLEPFPIDADGIDWRPVEAAEGEAITLDANEDRWRDQVRVLQPGALDDVREWVGVPLRVRERGYQFENQRRLTEEDLRAVPADATLERLEREQQILVVQAAKNLVYGYVDTTQAATPLYEAAARLILSRRLPMLFLADLVVNPGATVTLASSVAALTVFRVRIYKSGRIFAPDNAKIHCYSVEAGL